MAFKKLDPGFSKKERAQTLSHARSVVQEKQIAEQLGGKTVHRSGAGFVKGDVRVKDFARIEAKTTAKKSFSVNNDHLRALENSVAGTTEIPFMSIEIMGGAYKFAVIPEKYLPEIVDALKFYHANNK